MDWDDLKVLLALCRKGSARGAAQLLGVSNSTITRRLDELERQLKSRLFDRTPDGYRMTAVAEQLLPTAEHVEDLMMTAERRITGGDQHLEGVIRLTAPDVQGMASVMRVLGDFCRKYPGIELDLNASDEVMDLSRREADIAIRVLAAGEKPADYLIGRHISPISASAYVHRDMLNPDNPADISHLQWIGKDLQATKEPWLARTAFPLQPVRHSIANLNMLVGAVSARMGMAWMPCFAVKHHPEIVLVPGSEVIHHSDLWVLTHKDLRLTARLRALREALAGEFMRIAPQLDSR